MNEIQKRKNLLEVATNRLKSEFIGLDGIIDEISDIMMPWWIFPESQNRPLIINLWGMTGSGKSDLIYKLVKYLEYDKSYLRFDSGEYSSNSQMLKQIMTGNLNYYHQKSPIISLDEFQFAKTIDETGKEINNTGIRIIWDLIDSGIIHYEEYPDMYNINKLNRFIKSLGQFDPDTPLIEGKLSQYGEEINSMFKSLQFGYFDEFYRRARGEDFKFEDNEIFISDSFCNGLSTLGNANYLWQELSDQIKLLPDLGGIIQFITNIIEDVVAPKQLDFSKSLIFVIGNLDEAYTMSHNINPDIDADEFRRFTQKITIADIKTALQQRFRNEQIARLGNNHLIYHAFSHANFESLIEYNLKSISERCAQDFGFAIEFTDSLKKLIYLEGVFPTQGVRPVLSTIRNLIESNLAKIYFHIKEDNISTKKVKWNYVENDHIIDFSTEKTIKIKAVTKINNLRNASKDDMQALVAVHESGHTVVAMIAAQIIPEYVVTQTVDSESNGFSYIKLPEEIITKRLLIDRIRILLGGYAAESIVFGNNNNTTGVADDFNKATTIAQQLLRDYGMTGLPYKINIHQYGGNPYQFTYNDTHEKVLVELMDSCLQEVKDILETHKPFLLQLSQFLANHSRIERQAILDMYTNYENVYLKEKRVFIEAKDYYNFRNQLLKQSENLKQG